MDKKVALAMAGIAIAALAALLVFMPAAPRQAQEPETVLQSPQPEYPPAIRPLPEDVLSARLQELRSLGPRLCNALDAYGFVVSAGDCSECPPAAFNASHAQDLAMGALVNLSKFTGVPDRGSLVVAGAPKLVNGSFVVAFEGQKYRGLDVITTALDVRVCGDGVYSIRGHWYPEITVSGQPNITQADAKNRLLGSILQHDSENMTITAGDVGEAATLVVFPIYRQRPDQIEVRLAWRLEVASQWYAYVDAFTGKPMITPSLFASIADTGRVVPVKLFPLGARSH